MGISFKPIDIDERVLESELIKNPGLIEEGLLVLDHQIPTGSGYIDLLCADSKGALVVAELKIVEEDNMLIQALDYYDWVKEQADRLADRYREKVGAEKIDVALEPRILLVAPSFSSRLSRAVKYLGSPVDLVEFEYLETSSQERGLKLRNIPVGPVRGPPVATTLETHVDYITKKDVNELCLETIEKIKAIDSANIELKPTGSYLAFQFQGRNIASIETKRDFFYLGYPKKGEKGEWIYITVRKPEDVTDEAIGKIKDVYSDLSHSS